MVTNPALNMFFQNALCSLSSGQLNDLDRKVLSNSPLPSAYIEPFAEEKVDAVHAMTCTYNAMTVWIEEAKKANYFTKHFVTLSNLIRNGVAVMGRGLATLHSRGEDLSQAPMSIDDLIGLASYHFKKSYLGVLQTVKSHPEISERLLINQLGWNNTILRLYKTKEKLAKPAPQPLIEASQGAVGDATALEPLEEKSPRISGGVQALGDPAALAEPCSFGALRVYASFDGKPKKDPALPADSGKSASSARLTAPVSDPVPAEEAKSLPKPSAEEIRDPAPDSERTEDSAKDDETKVPMSAAEEVKETPAETGIPEESSEPAAYADPEVRCRSEKPEESQSPDDPGRQKFQSYSENLPPGTRIEELPLLPPEAPPYAKIMEKVVRRSAERNNGGLNFTISEMLALTADPDFHRFDPEMADGLMRFMARSGYPPNSS